MTRANSDQNQDNKLNVLSSTTVVGPMATPPELLRLKQTDKEDRPTPLNWEINAVWTAPEARRHGIARRLMREAIHQVQTQAAALARGTKDTAAAPVPDLFLTVGVARNNTAALSLYTQSGYVPFPEAEAGLDGEQEHTYLYLPVPYPGASQGGEGD